MISLISNDLRVISTAFSEMSKPTKVIMIALPVLLGLSSLLVKRRESNSHNNKVSQFPRILLGSILLICIIVRLWLSSKVHPSVVA